MALRRFPVLFLTFILVWGTSPAQADTSADNSKALITQFNATLLATMKAADELGYSGRYKKLAPAIESTYDLAFMTQYSAGRYWRALTADQKQKLVDAFSRLTVATYASRFDGYSGEKFKVVSEETPREGTRLVRSELIKSDGEVIKLNYLLRKSKEGWRVIDVFLKGTISELATKRSEYSSALNNRGFDGLMVVLERKISGLTAAKG